MKTESVVIYRSQFEADADKFLHDNPQYIVYIFIASVVLFSCMAIYHKIKINNWRKKHKF